MNLATHSSVKKFRTSLIKYAYAKLMDDTSWKAATWKVDES